MKELTVAATVENIETVTIDCVRYWDEHDLSSFAIYINYMLFRRRKTSY